MNRESVVTGIFCGILIISCGTDENFTPQCEENETKPCGRGACEGEKSCVNGLWSICSTVDADCGDCCYCDEYGKETFDCVNCHDLDNDGHNCLICGGDDCNDNNASIYPELYDPCDGVDNDCDQLIDEDETAVSCGNQLCAGFKQCVSGRIAQCRFDEFGSPINCVNDFWSECSSGGQSCGECCVCDEAGTPTQSCAVCEEGAVQACGQSECASVRVCADDAWSDCFSGGQSCGQCCRCDAEGREQMICNTCEDGESLTCGSGDCIGFKVCAGDAWSDCSSYSRRCGDCCYCGPDGNEQYICDVCEDGQTRGCGINECSGGYQICVNGAWGACTSQSQSCGDCCRCDEDGQPQEICNVCEDGQSQPCGSGQCQGYSECVSGQWSSCSTANDSCGTCCLCDLQGEPQSSCVACEEGQARSCGDASCGGYQICIAGQWPACSSQTDSCGHCCACDEYGNAQYFCTVCEHGQLRACGDGACSGYQLCLNDEWLDCSTEGIDCGTCCRCDADGQESFDEDQYYDCPNTDCPELSSCVNGWALCGGYLGGQIYYYSQAHQLAGACQDVHTCANQSCLAGDWLQCEADSDSDGYSPSCGDCDDTSSTVRPNHPEVCNDWVDNNCDGQTDEGCCPDLDGDSYEDAACGGSDCNDNNVFINPSVPEGCDDLVDNNCDGQTDEGCCPDLDGDSFRDAACGGSDCNDNTAQAYPGAMEICDGLDNDCDSGIDNIMSHTFDVSGTFYVIPNAKCASDPCCYYPNHFDIGMISTINFNGIDFTAINPAVIYTTVNVNNLYYSNTANSQAQVQFILYQADSTSQTLANQFNFPRADQCGTLSYLLSSGSAVIINSFTSSLASHPVSLELFVPSAGDYGIALRNFSATISMSCY
ncbi:MAG: MopE-related protein [Patescibacteria group bacterium]